MVTNVLTTTIITRPPHPRGGLSRLETDMRQTRTRRLGALLVGLALVGAACGGDDTANDADPTTDTEAATPANN